jgi:hypothetical protein
LVISSLKWVAGVLGCLATGSLSAQAPNAPAAQWTIDGLVQRGLRTGPDPVVNQWVVVHRIASDSTGKVSGGPLDSARSDARGHFRVRFPHLDARATYIAITTYQGVSYISNPLTKPVTSGEDAGIMVFDTTSPPYPIKVAGRHFVITAPDASDRRRVVEVYELLNDSVQTVMGTEANPVWRAPIPANAADVQINPVGDISPAMTKIDKSEIKVFSPISPGLRQIAFSYTLGPDEFPLIMPVVDSASVFEMLVQEQAAAIDGGGFTEVQAVLQDGLQFRRFLAQNVPARATIRIQAPKPVGRLGSKVIRTVVVVASAVMLAVLALVFWRKRRVAAAPGISAPRPVDALVAELAMMDADFERRANATSAERAEYDARRNQLKARLNAALAAERGGA